MSEESSEMYIGPGVVEAIIRLGRAQERLKFILDNVITDRISKHDPMWHSEHEREGDILDDARCKLNRLHDDLWDLMALIQPEGD